MAAVGGMLFVWWNGHVDPQTIGLRPTINVLIMAVIGGLRRLEGAFVGAFAYVFINDRLAETDFSVGGVKLGTFNSLVGLDLPRHRARLARRPARPLGPRALPSASAVRPQRSPPATNRFLTSTSNLPGIVPPTQRRHRT